MHSRMVLSLRAHSIPKQIAHSNASPCHTTKRCAGRRKRSRGNQGPECKKGIRLEHSGGVGRGRCTLPLCGLIGGLNSQRGRGRRRRPQDVRRRDEWRLLVRNSARGRASRSFLPPVSGYVLHVAPADEAVASAGYRAIAPDMRGYGRSSAPADAGSDGPAFIVRTPNRDAIYLWTIRIRAQ
jgi:hypothetical protein